ncbi:MAG: endonuclease [Candidatus Zambryskibacteria bacterium RIFCSPLOWO2_02_FULL_51_21]|nr:MAG: endonuclease [Candidatus Zambryskibacteria bacterium RIFCSPHIGHO2_01_FULL_52_18]OHB06733.1 MAG: endonuclease [Candidatus Zambryskibacteria bacterium RIFCSPLOWO2_01_FULL_52_12]OHB11459.1 MAG: endonuclease [Candidatus Zambryskibacteria bacterium RIFCSPLOWO2_02_FULL_51_21]
MYSVYVLKSLNRNYIYVGISDNVLRRLGEHNAGWNRTTKPYKPFKLLHTEDFPDRIGARKREKWFKSGEGKEFVKKHFR